jgi:hypothetical protein
MRRRIVGPDTPTSRATLETLRYSRSASRLVVALMATDRTFLTGGQ